MDIKTTDTNAYKFGSIGSTANLNVGSVYNTKKDPEPVVVVQLTKKEQKAADKAAKKEAKKNK